MLSQVIKVWNSNYLSQPNVSTLYLGNIQFIGELFHKKQSNNNGDIVREETSTNPHRAEIQNRAQAPKLTLIKWFFDLIFLLQFFIFVQIFHLVSLFAFRVFKFFVCLSFPSVSLPISDEPGKSHLRPNIKRIISHPHFILE